MAIVVNSAILAERWSANATIGTLILADPPYHGFTMAGAQGV